MQQRNDQDEDDRTQRSQSAPPSEQGKNFGPDHGRTFVGGQQQKQHGEEEERREPVVRHIPIFVEGRDEPVLPKDVVDSPSSSWRPSSKTDAQEHHHHQSNHRQTRQIPVQTGSNSGLPPHQGSRQMPVQTESRQGEAQPTKGPREVPIQVDGGQPSGGGGGWEIPIQVNNPQQAKPPPPKPVRLGPLDQVKLVQEEVTALQKQVEDFKGSTRQDKNYILLDEMLTRNLLKLDNIETEGKDDVRVARKETIRSIQRCISMLENKVPSDDSANKTEADSNQTEQDSDKKDDPPSSQGETKDSPKPDTNKVTDSPSPSAS